MTVGELMEALGKIPPDAEIEIRRYRVNTLAALFEKIEQVPMRDENGIRISVDNDVVLIDAT